MDKNSFNEEPVYYCPHCLSLRIKIFDSSVDYCDDCGCTDIAQTDIFTWMNMYKDKFGEDFI